MDRFLIAGLGNPGERYKNTRHNIGFMVIDALIQHFNISVSSGFYSDFGDTVTNGKKIYIQKPQTFMNLSGKAVASLAGYYNIDIKDILVIYDDVDLPFGKIKIKTKGSSAGHKGLISIISCLGSDEFPRAKMGIGRPANPGFSISDYVLGKFSPEESKHLDKFINLCKNAALCFIEEGLIPAMTKFNNKTIKKED